jgi:hypothetical protein
VDLCAVTGHRLELRAQGTERKEAFRREVGLALAAACPVRPSARLAARRATLRPSNSKPGLIVRACPAAPQALLPALQKLVDLPEWAVWRAALGRLYPYPPEAEAEL